MDGPILLRFVRPLIALLIVFGVFAFIFILLYRAVPESNKDILNIVLGVMMAKVGDITAYYYGNSKDKSDAEQASRNSTTTTATTVTTPPDPPITP